MVAIILTVFLVAVLWAVVLALHLPVVLAVVATIAMALAWAAALGWRWYAARRAASQLESGLKAQADAQASAASPDQQADIEEMRAEFAKAVQALKASRLGQGGRNALAVLPWYLIIGPPGAGKSTALRASGLRFPYATRRGGVRGVGGTRNCEWWLTNQAVILDTAGRYATEDEDHEEWTEFLDVVAKARRRRPVNGLLVAVPFTDVAAGSEEAAAELGRTMRERIDEVMARLQVVLPVYVLLTKCDLLPGFVESFADLRKGERNQVWGFTVPLAAGAERAAEFGERYDELVGVIEARALRRLADERQLVARERIYELPQHLAAAKPQLGAFLETLVAENVYQETPILRGLYLTSGTQEGRLVDRIMASMAEAFGVRPALAEVVPAIDAKSYFLRDVFDKVVFPDQHLAFRGAAAVRRQRIRDAVVVAAAAALLLLFLAFPLRAYLESRAFIRATAAEVEAAAARLAAAGDGPPPLSVLEPLRERMALLVRYQQEGPPWSLRFGMYRGDALLPDVRRLYAGTVRRLVLDPVFRRQVQDLEAFVARLEGTDRAPGRTEHARFYDRLRLYLMLTAPRELAEPALAGADEGWIATQIAAAWEASGTAPEETPLIEKHAALYAKLLATDPSLALPRSPSIVQRARRILSRLPLSVLAEERLAAEASGKAPDLSLATLVGRPVSALQARQGVRGAYTRRGYEEIVKPRLDRPEALMELWVLATANPGEDRISVERERIRSRYFERYIEEWRGFLDGLSIAPGVKPQALLEDLTAGEPALYPRLFRAVAHHTRIAGVAGLVGNVVKGAVAKGQGGAAGAMAGAAAARGAEREELRFGPGEVEQAFDGFVRFGVPPEALPGPGGGAPPPRTSLDLYQDAIVTLRDAGSMSAAGGPEERKLYPAAAAKAQVAVQALLRTAEGGWGPRLQALLLEPVRVTSAEARTGPVKVVAGAWCDLVVKPFRGRLAGRYPFVRGGPDAAFPDVVEFFRPVSGAVWGLYGKSLEGVVQRSGDGFRFAPEAGEVSLRPALLAYLRRAQEITSALFPPGAQDPSVPFSVRVHSAAPIASVVLVIDGQRYEYQNGPELWRAMVWPNRAAGGGRGASLRFRTADGTEGSVVRDGEWGLLRWLEAGRIVGTPGERDFTVAFDTNLGPPVRIDFHLEQSVSPFFRPRQAGPSSLLAPFRTFPPAPGAIGAGAPPCE